MKCDMNMKWPTCNKTEDKFKVVRTSKQRRRRSATFSNLYESAVRQEVRRAVNVMSGVPLYSEKVCVGQGNHWKNFLEVLLLGRCSKSARYTLPPLEKMASRHF